MTTWDYPCIKHILGEFGWLSLSRAPQTQLFVRSTDFTRFPDAEAEAICERPAAPVLRDVAEQPVLDLVPLRRAGRIVVDTDDEPGLVGQLLQFDLPEPHSRTIRAAAVRRDCQFSCLRIARSSHAIVPATDRRHGELSPYHS